MTKNISFRPSPLDKVLIDKIIENGSSNSVSDVIRSAIRVLAISELGNEEVEKLIVKAYMDSINEAEI